MSDETHVVMQQYLEDGAAPLGAAPLWMLQCLTHQMVHGQLLESLVI